MIALRLLEIFMELTERRANMNVAEIQAFRQMPDFCLMEAVLHNCLQYVWHDGDLPILDQRERVSTFNFLSLCL